MKEVLGKVRIHNAVKS